MEYTTLGETGMTVSRLCLGCMTFGYESSSKYDWSISEEQSNKILDRAIDLGITFFDTSNSYSYGDSERILGSKLSEYDREAMTVATKVCLPADEDAHLNASGLSRKTIEQEIEHSLERLEMDTIDLYQIHRWDDETPIEETIRALDDCVRRGKTRYIGASSMWTYQFASALHTSDQLNRERFLTMQNHYNLVYREEEREMLPYCKQEGIGVIPWSPLAKGFLTRPHEEMEATQRGQTDDLLHNRPYAEYGGKEINERVEELAADKGVKMAQIALSWVLHKDWVDAPIVGTTSVEHLEDAVEALEISLSDSDLEYLEEPYQPTQISGHGGYT